MLSNGIAFLGGDRWSVSPRISDINYQVATQDQQLDVVDRWGHFLNSIGENMGVRITVATCMLDPEEVTHSIAMPPARRHAGWVARGLQPQCTSASRRPFPFHLSIRG